MTLPIWFFGHFKKRLKLVSGAGRHCMITTFQYRRLLLNLLNVLSTREGGGGLKEIDG